MLKLQSIRLALVAGLFLSAGTAHALTYCDDKNPCPSGKECFVAVCVPSTSVCTADANCKSYQSCDFTCKVSGSGTVSTTTPVEPDAGLVAVDGGSPSTDGGSSDQKMQPDATGVVDTATPPPEDAYVPPPVPECPKNKGVCTADQKKIPAQPGCTEFCKTMATCGGLGGSSSSGSSGGSSGSGGGSAPPQTDAGSAQVDAGSTGFAPKDAGEAQPQPVDAEAYPDAQPVDMNVEGPDTSIETTQAQIDMCIQLCSVVKLGGYITKEWGALEQCVVDNIGKCDVINATCQALSEPVGNAFEGNETLAIDMLGLNFGSSQTTSGGGTTETGGGKGSDNADAASTGMPRYQGDATNGGDALGSSDAKTSTVPPSSTASSSGCTSGSTGGSLGGLAGLIGLCSALILRRKFV